MRELSDAELGAVSGGGTINLGDNPFFYAVGAVLWVAALTVSIAANFFSGLFSRESG